MTMLHGIPNIRGGTTTSANDSPLPTRVVRANWQADWKWPVPQGFEPVGRLVNGAGETGGMVIMNATVWRRLGTDDHYLGMCGKLSPMKGNLPPIVATDTDPVE